MGEKTVSKSKFSRRLIIFRFFLFFLLIIFSILSLFAKKVAYFPIDLQITKTIQQFHSFWFDLLMKGITQLGNPITGPIIIALVTLFIFYNKRYKIALMLLISSIGGYILVEGVKIFVSRARPDPNLIHQLGHYMRNDSFPSGHVLFFVSFFGFLLFITYSHLAKNVFRKIIMGILVILLLLIGPSRMYLGAHWFSDVMGAYIIGFLWLTLMITIYKKIEPNTKSNSK